MEIIDEETGFNDKTYGNATKKSETLKNTWKTRYFFLTDKQFEQREEEKRTGLKSLTKEEANTMVCDGAKFNLFSFSYNLKIYYENKKIKNVYEKTILKMDNDLELTKKVEIKGKKSE